MLAKKKMKWVARKRNAQEVSTKDSVWVNKKTDRLARRARKRAEVGMKKGILALAATLRPLQERGGRRDRCNLR